MLECCLEFSYGQKKCLDISFRFMKGIYGLFGRNGSGKTTLLRILGGSLPVKKGSVKISGLNALGPDGYVRADVKKNFGILFQETSSDEKLSLKDNLFYSALLMGVDKSKINSLIKETLDRAGLSLRASEPVKKLSGGMRRRLELYRTFMHEPKILLLDEPTTGLDVKEISRFSSFLREYQQRTDALVIISSHNPEELLVCERVLFLAEGALLADSSPETLLKSLDFLRLSVKLSGENYDFDPQAFELFDIYHDKKNALLEGKIYSKNLNSLVQDSRFLSNLKGFVVDKPNLADAYENLMKAALGEGDGRYL